jgi:toxin CcdB
MQGDVNVNPDDPAGQTPFLLDVQADLLSELATRVVVPLVRAASFGRRASRLHPAFTVGGQDVVMATHLIAAVRRSTVGSYVASLRDQRDVIIAAIDVLWSGV